MKRIDKTLGKKIVELYTVDHLSCTKIGKLVNKQTITICRYLKSQGIKVINFASIPKINDELGELIIRKYTKDNDSISQISKDVNVSVTVISKYLKANGIQIINQQNRAKFNENIFDSIDNEEKAYWLGFIYADGCLSSRDNGFELSLSIKDIKHLEKFNSFMEHEKDNVRIGTSKYNGKELKRCRWGVTNKHLWETLNNLGCTPRKSKTLKFPDIYLGKFTKDFIRGYFDGDGCITYKKDTVESQSTIVGTECFLKKVQEILQAENIVSKIREDKRMKYTKVLCISSKSERDFLNYIYSGSTIYLDRKFKRFEFFSICRSAKELAEFLESEIGES